MRLTGDQKKSKNFGIFKFFPNAGIVEENTWHFEVLLLFLSLRYGADLGRSRLVIKGRTWKQVPQMRRNFRESFDRFRCYSATYSTP